MRKFLVGAATVAVVAGAVLMPGSAQAWWRGGGFYGPGIFLPPIVVGPPVVYDPYAGYPPPVVYAPPPGYYPAPPAPGYATPPPGQTCYAGPYVCPLDRQLPEGSACSCPTNQGRAAGQVR